MVMLLFVEVDFNVFELFDVVFVYFIVYVMWLIVLFCSNDLFVMVVMCGLCCVGFLIFDDLLVFGFDGIVIGELFVLLFVSVVMLNCDIGCYVW